MNEEREAKAANEETIFSRQVGAQAKRKLKAQAQATRASGSAWACPGWSAGRSRFPA